MHHFEHAEKKEVFEPRYKIKMNMEDKISRPQQLYVFEVMRNGKLFSKSREANLYLAEVSLLIQNHEQAAVLLKQFGTKLRAYTPTEIEILEKISSINTITGNIEGNALGIQMYAFYLLEKNYRDFPKEVKKNQLTSKLGFTKRYEQYLSHLNATQALRLSKEEELYLIRAAGPSQVINNRLQELRGVEKPYSAIEKMTPKDLNFKKLNLGSLRLWKFKSDLTQFKMSNLTRGSAELNGREIPLLYAKSLESSANDPYRTALIYWKHHAKDPNERMKAILLMLILDHKDRFPPIPNNLNIDNFDEWWSKVVAIANDVAKEFPPVKPIKKTTDILPKKPISIETPVRIPVEPFQLQAITPFRNKEIVGDTKDAWFSQAERPITPGKLSTRVEKEPIPHILDQLVKISTGRDQKPDPLIKKEVDRISKDCTAYDKQPPPPYYHLNDDALAEIEAFCTQMTTSKEEDSHLTKIDTLEKEILGLARQSPLTEFGIARKDLQTWSGKQKPLKIGELIINFAKQDPSALKARNPALSSADIRGFMKKSVLIYNSPLNSSRHSVL